MSEQSKYIFPWFLGGELRWTELPYIPSVPLQDEQRRVKGSDPRQLTRTHTHTHNAHAHAHAQTRTYRHTQTYARVTPRLHRLWHRHADNYVQNTTDAAYAYTLTTNVALFSTIQVFNIVKGRGCRIHSEGLKILNMALLRLLIGSTCG